MGVNKRSKPTTPLRVGQPILVLTLIVDDLVHVVRPTRGRIYACAIASPSRSGLTPLRRGGYDKSDLSEVLSRLSSTSFLYYDHKLSS